MCNPGLINPLVDSLLNPGSTLCRTSKSCSRQNVTENKRKLSLTQSREVMAFGPNQPCKLSQVRRSELPSCFFVCARKPLLLSFGLKVCSTRLASPPQAPRSTGSLRSVASSEASCPPTHRRLGRCSRCTGILGNGRNRKQGPVRGSKLHLQRGQNKGGGFQPITSPHPHELARKVGAFDHHESGNSWTPAKVNSW